MRFRIYIDESGNSDLRASSFDDNRFLSLTGIIIKEDYARTHFREAVEKLKEKHFPLYPKIQIIFHRTDIMNKRGPFFVLKNQKILSAFNKDLLSLLNNLSYTVITVVIDKYDHLNKYTVWRADPYHYCMEVLLERFYWFLRKAVGVGDVMVEARSKKLDKRLKNAYGRLYHNGTNFIRSDELKKFLTSKELKLEPKESNIAGLQIADLLAHPCCAAMKADQFGNSRPQNFGSRIVEVIEKSKYYRSPNGKIEGYGKKWLP